MNNVIKIKDLKEKLKEFNDEDLVFYDDAEHGDQQATILKKIDNYTVFNSRTRIKSKHTVLFITSE